MQNADDAGAKVIKLCLDFREHGTGMSDTRPSKDLGLSLALLQQIPHPFPEKCTLQQQLSLSVMQTTWPSPSWLTCKDQP